MRVKGGLHSGFFHADEVHLFAFATEEDEIVIRHALKKAQGVDATFVVVTEDNGGSSYFVHAQTRGAHHQRVILPRRRPTYQRAFWKQIVKHDGFSTVIISAFASISLLILCVNLKPLPQKKCTAYLLA